ncbi:MAG: yheB [Brevibacillus sp.]|nr:yheB [Brevibacillus sp.]
MNIWTILVNIGVGSVIGGVTNELAIRMLFRPLKPWYIGRWRVPFTPGLIPSRRDDIALQMGRLVEEHLLTMEGVKRALTQSGLENTLADWMNRVATDWMTDEQSLRQVLQRALPQIFQEDGTWSDSLRQPLQLHWQTFVDRTLYQYEEKTLRELITPAGRERLDTALDTVSEMLLLRFREFLHSSEGQQSLQSMIRGLLGGGGGMFGGLVGMFLGDDKILGKLLPHLDDLLQRPELSQKLRQMLEIEADKLLDKNVGELAQWIGRDQIDDWSRALFARLEEQSQRIMDEPMSRLTSPFQKAVSTELIPRLTRWMVETLEKNVERIFQKLAIRDIVTRQVEGFPIERIEEMVVGISGREFRMITVLGFILGGIIGLVQGMLSSWMG